jgi:hypothetical protein
VVGSSNSGYYFLGGLAISFGTIIFLFFRYHKKMGGRIFDKDKNIEDTDYSAQWLEQKELEKSIVVLKDDVEPMYAT